MKIHYFQHVPFEGLGSIERWAERNHHTVTVTRFFDKDIPPSMDSIDGLIVMGGPMSVHETDQYAWLLLEKQLIQQAITLHKPVLGICLGAQLIAESLGGTVHRNRFPEIGWWPIEKVTSAPNSKIAALFPNKMKVFHWHGETFTLPSGAIQLARSTACEQQAFIYGDRVLGLQFHLEITPEMVELWIKQGAHELVESRYIQPTATILATSDDFAPANAFMDSLLDSFMTTSIG